MTRRAKPGLRPTAVTPALLRRWALPSLDERLGKVARGQVLVIGGSDEIPGAAILAAIAALRAGAGTLIVATSTRSASPVAVAVPEARVIRLRTTSKGELAASAVGGLRADIARSDAILVGPGMRDGRVTTGVIAELRKTEGAATLVLDAGALDVVATLRPAARAPRALITPHPGEMAKLLDIDVARVLAEPLTIARSAARDLGVTVVLKGNITHIAAPDGTCFINTAGNLGLGTSGSGDTLSGIIAGLCARGADAMQAAVWGVHVHAKAGEVLARTVAPLGYLARELLAEVPALIGQYSRRAPRR
ncbi:MAG: NAD(P)H-hydrate dehydratase [Myxococcales bacterium]|nr:NAD(P)H-hydrate dehydratase [Myxococcales bacterium]